MTTAERNDQAGRIYVETAEIATRQTEDGTLLFHVPSSRMVKLDFSGKELWDSIADNAPPVEDLVNRYATSTGIPTIAATQQVLDFLEVLQAEGFLRFDLPVGTAERPGIDVTLDVPTQLTFDADAEDGALKSFLQSSGPSSVVSLTASRPTLTVSEAGRLGLSKAGIAHDDSSELSLTRIFAVDLEAQEAASEATLWRLSTTPLAKVSQRDRRFVEVSDPNGTMSLQDVLDAQQQAAGGGISTKRRASRRVIIGVGICIGRICIIVIIVINDPGPSFGKSRSACKTVCV